MDQGTPQLPRTRTPNMKKRQENSSLASALQITTSVVFLSVSALLLSLAASPRLNRAEQNRSDTDSMPQRVAPELKPVEREAWLAMAQRKNPETVTANTWSSTGSLSTARWFHTATLLPNGKVLVAGGLNDGTGPLSSAELYDPAKGSWGTTGSLGTARREHTATLLPNGKVLVVGGYNGEFLSSAELYDAATGSWSSTGSLGTPRWFHTATLLPNGKVLVVGGGNSSGPLSSAELYDPATGSWSNTGSLGTAREQHTATLLP